MNALKSVASGPGQHVKSVKSISCPQQQQLRCNNMRARSRATPRLLSSKQLHVTPAAAASIAAAAAVAAPTASSSRNNTAGGALTTAGIVYHDPKWNEVQNEQQFFSILEVGGFYS